ncbi:MAG: GNAT family N-acetyltransferase [Dehalococcoidales bacterium]|nr:GNAT family N-acetyltransferase [Dehalococcoidales bacterium]
MNITLCTKADYDEILTDLDDFWNSSNIESLRRQHNPVFLYEFGNTAFVVKEGDTVTGYLFGLYSQTEPVAYVKFVGVRASYRKRGVGRALYDFFTETAVKQGCRQLKAITTAKNSGSIAFHRKMGMTLLGEPDENGVTVVKDYAGPGQDRVVFVKDI